MTTLPAGETVETTTCFTPRFDAAGLVTAVVTDAQTGHLLMVAHMNAEAIAKSVETGMAHFWSRSRGRLWRKGEESGNGLKIVEMLTDCDQDTIWIKARLHGTAACHTGAFSCFYRAIAADAQGRLHLKPAERL